MTRKTIIAISGIGIIVALKDQIYVNNLIQCFIKNQEIHQEEAEVEVEKEVLELMLGAQDRPKHYLINQIAKYFGQASIKSIRPRQKPNAHLIIFIKRSPGIRCSRRLLIQMILQNNFKKIEKCYPNQIIHKLNLAVKLKIKNTKNKF